MRFTFFSFGQLRFLPSHTMVNGLLKTISVLFLLCILLLARPVFSQTVDAAPDTLLPIESSAIKDSVRVDDRPGSREIEAPIYYEAQDIQNLVDEKKTILTGRAQVKYQKISLKAAQITVDWETNTLLAVGRWDTVWVQTADGDSIRQPKQVELPEFSEAGDVMRGETMQFNFKTKKGRVLRGRTVHEDGFYYGNTLKLNQKNTVNVGKATFTTCDKEDDPHFHFWMDKMKIINKEKVVAKPIVLFVGHIPVMVLPFGYFPIQRQRHSGIVFPKYGESSVEGRYLRGLGYYWAPSQYFDLEATVDYFEKSGFLFRADLNYAKRYKLKGRISGSWTRKDFELQGTKKRVWDLDVSHTQEISPTTRLIVSGRFVSSGNFYQNLSSNREHQLQKEIRSNARLTKRWGASGKIELYMNQTRNLETDRIKEVLPRVSISNNWKSLIPQAGRRSKMERWYHAVRMPYRFEILGERERFWEDSETDTGYVTRELVGMNHDFDLYAQPKFFGWLTLKPTISYNEIWYNQRKGYAVNPETNKVEETDEKGFFAVRTYSASVNMNTKIYGIFRSGLLPDVTVRHVATPSIGFSFKPDFSEEQYGYYQTVTDTAGNDIQKNRYVDNLFGSLSKGEQRRMSVSLNNAFQMRIGDGEEARKFELFTWNLSTNYNWKAENYKLADLSSNIQARPLKSLSLSLRSTYSFYPVDSTGSRIDRLAIKDVSVQNWKRFFDESWMRLTSVNMGLTFRIQGKARIGSDEKETDDTEELPDDIELSKNVPGDRFQADDEVSGMELPWSFNARLSYTERRTNPQNISKTFWANLGFEFNVTKNWKVSYKTRLDLEEKKVVSQDFIFYRDLHCWEARIVWVPTGYNKRFYFKINVKSGMLRDLKVEKGSGQRGFYGG